VGSHFQLRKHAVDKVETRVWPQRTDKFQNLGGVAGGRALTGPGLLPERFYALSLRVSFERADNWSIVVRLNGEGYLIL
jgi:hypothetical protein